MEGLRKPEDSNILKGQVGQNGWDKVTWLWRTPENVQDEILHNIRSSPRNSVFRVFFFFFLEGALTNLSNPERPVLQVWVFLGV